MALILIADDETAILESTSELLELYGHEAVTVSQAERILPTIETARPDLLLQDAKMPGLDLARHLETLHERFPRLGVIVFTGDPEIQESLVRKAVDATLPKPFDPAELAALIDRALAEHHRRA